MSNKNEFHDEEYQFPQEDFNDDLLNEQPVVEETQEKILPEAEQQPVKKSGLTDMLASNKRMYTVIGVVVVVGIVFAVMRVAHKPAQPSVPTLPPAPVVQQVAVNPQVVAAIDSLKEDSLNNSNNLNQLQSQVQQLTSALNQSRSQQQQLGQSVMLLATQVQQLSAQVKVLSQPKLVKIAAPVPVVKKPEAPAITYQLRAVVPGRAWIVASDGQSQSVAVGDHVQQYGVVQSIDADAGVVITTSGKTIKF
jgi:intracellular multiplication protein IcmG